LLNLPPAAQGRNSLRRRVPHTTPHTLADDA